MEEKYHWLHTTSDSGSELLGISTGHLFTLHNTPAIKNIPSQGN